MSFRQGRMPVLFYRTKPILEDCFCFSIVALKKAGGLYEGAAGIYREGNSSLSYRVIGAALHVAYSTMRDENRYEVEQSIAIATIALQLRNVSQRACFLCPGCERRCYNLYTCWHSPKLACRLCLALSYELQNHHHDNLIYCYVRLHKHSEEREARYIAWLRRGWEYERIQNRNRVRRHRQRLRAARTKPADFSQSGRSTCP